MQLIVVDDQFDEIAADLQNIAKTFEVRGLKAFDSAKLLELATSPCVVLLDVVDAEAGRPDAGITLFTALGHAKQWQALNGRAQIIIFTSEQRVRDRIEVAKAHRLDLAGYISKKELLAGSPFALAQLAAAKDRAEMYEFSGRPALASIRKECNLSFSPNSPMQKVWEQILYAGRCSEPVLIRGDTGTGKELVAQAIFKVMKAFAAADKLKLRGSFGDEPLSYNIGAAPTEGNVQYTELFGAVKDAVPNMKYRKGLFQAAGLADDQTPGKTIFLDEIGDAPPIIQTALLRVLQSNEVVPLGWFDENKPAVKVKYRLINASHRNLPQRAAKGHFREDLYYRLSTLEIDIPPLNQRLEDIEVLIHVFMDALNAEYEALGHNKEADDPAIYDILKKYNWPGNVRQLEHFVRRRYVMSPPNRMVLRREDLDEFIRLATSNGDKR